MKEQLIGQFDEKGYRIVNESDVVLFEAGNNPHDSDPSCTLPVGQGLGLEKIRIMCDQTGRDIANSRQAEWNGIEYVGENIEVPCTVKITIERIKDLLMWAMERRLSDHWAKCEEWFSDRRQDGEDGYDLVLRDHHTKYPFLDVDDSNHILGYLCFDNMVKALRYMAAGEDRNHEAIPMRHWENLVGNKPDSETADVFLQLAIMERIVYPFFPAV